MTSSESTKKVHTNADDTHVMVDGSVRIASGVYIHPSAVIGAGVSLGEGVCISDRVRIGHGATIGKWTFVKEHARIGKGATVGSNCFIYHDVTVSDSMESDSVGVVIGDNCTLHPFVNIHTGVALGHHVQVGAETIIPAHWRVPPWYYVNQAEPYPALIPNHTKD